MKELALDIAPLHPAAQITAIICLAVVACFAIYGWFRLLRAIFE